MSRKLIYFFSCMDKQGEKKYLLGLQGLRMCPIRSHNFILKKYALFCLKDFRYKSFYRYEKLMQNFYANVFVQLEIYDSVLSCRFNVTYEKRR